MIVTSRVNGSSTSLAALSVWTAVWSEVERFVAETREALGSHLRDHSIAARRVFTREGSESGEVVIGRTILELECPLDCWTARREEPLFRAVFGSEAPLARIFVRRSDEGSGRLESVLAADPVRAVWIASESDLGLAPLADRAALERFLWDFIADR